MKLTLILGFFYKYDEQPSTNITVFCSNDFPNLDIIEGMCVILLNWQKVIFAENGGNNSLPPNSTRSDTKLIFLSHYRFNSKIWSILMLIAKGDKIGKMRNFLGRPIWALGEENIKYITKGQSNLHSPVHLQQFRLGTFSLIVASNLCRSTFCWKFPIPEVEKIHC